MPPKASPVCRMSGCGAPRHVYPSGSLSQYCKEHMHYRKSKQRDGQPSMTGQMRDILVYLVKMKRAGYIWVQLKYPFAHGKTLDGLFERDWVFRSTIESGTAYKITFRGEDALAYFDATASRRDGICPRCRINPRHVRSGGDTDGYCIECLRIRGIEKRKRGGCNGDITRPCSRCKKRGRHQYPNGQWSTYCKHCEAVNRCRNARKQRRRLVKAIQSGAPTPICKRCGERPRRVFTNSISDYCAICLPTQMRKLKLKRRFAHHQIYL